MRIKKRIKMAKIKFIIIKEYKKFNKLLIIHHKI